MRIESKPTEPRNRPMNKSLSGHQSAHMKNDEWLTPPDILQVLGEFDLDPCAPQVRPWATADKHFSSLEGGLEMTWRGRVWLNPPFGREAIKWLGKLAEHGNGIALLPARTETKMFFEHVWPRAQAICFLKGRPHFYYVDGTRAPFNSGAPICLIAYGEDNVQVLQKSGLGQTLTISS